MPTRPLLPALLAGGLVAAVGATASAQSSPQPAFGSQADIAYARALWQAMNQQRLAGPQAFQARPYRGRSAVHGAVLETVKGRLTVEGRPGRVIVKRNYGPKEVSLDAVWQKPDQHLKSITVMMQRDAGYAPDGGDWFWVKYMPDGAVARMKGHRLAGRVTSCIRCHSRAGSDFVFRIGSQK